VLVGSATLVAIVLLLLALSDTSWGMGALYPDSEGLQPSCSGTTTCNSSTWLHTFSTAWQLHYAHISSAAGLVKHDVYHVV